MALTKCTKTRYEIELNEKGEIINCFQEDKNCIAENGVEIASYNHRAPIDFYALQKSLSVAKVSSLVDAII